MDRRRFFINRSLNEGLSSNQRASLLEDTFAELNRLYEADENPEGTTTGAEQENSSATNNMQKSVAEIKKEVQNVDIPEVGIKLTGKADELYAT